ncbi:MAG: 50S ribosomal protein L10 [Candidatus Woesearchaeota archaeon]|nr:50S ribosomal protein L10 [Candidatus Woesearchaeota archaeon]
MADLQKIKAHVAPYKKETVERLSKLFREYPIIGVLNVENLPAAQFQKIRAQLRDKAHITMSKRRLIKIAIDKVKNDVKGIESLVPLMGGMPALIFTKENPFSIYKFVKKNKTSAPAKPGQIAPRDIVVTAGPTPFAPGPVIGELGAIGIKTGVEGGKVVIKQDSVVVRAGSIIKPNVASVLLRLGIEPMEIGLDIVAIYEKGTIYKKDVLDVDEEALIKDLATAYTESFNLAVEAGIFTKDTLEFMIQKASRETKSLALEAGIITEETAAEVLAKAEAQANALKEEIKL